MSEPTPPRSSPTTLAPKPKERRPAVNLGTIGWNEILLAAIVVVLVWAKLDGWG